MTIKFEYLLMIIKQKLLYLCIFIPIILEMFNKFSIYNLNELFEYIKIGQKYQMKKSCHE